MRVLLKLFGRRGPRYVLVPEDLVLKVCKRRARGGWDTKMVGEECHVSAV
jgi:hypothetical protein